MSPRGEQFEWVAGFNYDDNINDSQQAPNINGSALTQRIPGMNPSGLTFTRLRNVDENAESWAIFGEATFNLTDELSISGGGRYSEVRKEATVLTCSATIFTSNCFGPLQQNGAGFTFTQSRKDSDFQPSVVVEWSPNASINTYASYKEGFKAGGFDHALNAPDANAFAYEPEEATAYEIGAKTRFWDNRASLDIALFRNEFENLQVSVFSGQGINFNVANAAAARSQGLELDGRVAANEWLTLGASVQFLDAEFTDYAGAPCYTRQTAAQGCITPAGGGAATQDLSGRDRPQAPNYSATLTADWDVPLNDTYDLTGGVNLFITDGFFTIADLDPVSVQDSYAKLGARVGIANTDSGWSLSLIGRNLTNEIVSPWRGDCPFGVCTIALVDRARSVAVQASATF